MPKALSEYNLKDWSHLRPVLHRLKTMRYRAIDRRYSRRPARAGNTNALARTMHGQNVLIAIAFEDAQATAWQAELMRRYLPEPMYVIADNSVADASAAEIEAVAKRFSIPYIRLPRTSWRAASRSHGLALNWVWQNLVRLGEPEAFGFIDDDLFPTAPDHPFQPLASQDFYGVVRNVGHRWFLWAGYCTFRFDKVKDKPLDFGQDWFIGLDTGGANWDVLYRHVDLNKLRIPHTEFVPYKDGVELASGA